MAIPNSWPSLDIDAKTAMLEAGNVGRSGIPQGEPMRKIAAWGLPAFAMMVSATLVGASSRVGDGPDSGIPVGDFISPFDVRDITGPNKGQTLCYR